MNQEYELPAPREKTPFRHDSEELSWTYIIDMWERFDASRHQAYLERSVRMFLSGADTARLSIIPTQLELYSFRVLACASHSRDFDISEMHALLLNLAASLTPDGDPRKPLRLKHLARRLANRFQGLGNFGDLDGAITSQERAVSLLADEHPDKPLYLDDLARALRHRFQRRGAPADLNGAIAAQRRAVALTKHGLRNEAQRLRVLGQYLWDRHTRAGQIDDLNEMIHSLGSYVKLAAGNTDQIDVLSNFEYALRKRFERLGHLEDLERAVLILYRVIDLTPDAHPNKPIYLSNLGSILRRGFERWNRPQDIERSITAQRRAVDLTSDDDRDKSAWLSNLGNSLLSKFGATGELQDLEDALSAHRRALELTPDGDTDKPMYTNNFAHSLKARFDRVGELEDIDLAITMHRRAVEILPVGHPARPPFIRGLGLALLSRSKRTGELNEISEALALMHHAAELLPGHHPQKWAWIGELGGAYTQRFDRTGALVDLESAISAERRAIANMSDGDPAKGTSLNSLGVSLQRRFECANQLHDLEDAIIALRCAVELVRDDHPSKPAWLMNLGSCLMHRFANQGNRLEDIDNAVEVQRQALERTPNGHPSKPGRLTNLGNSLLQRFRRFGQQEDLASAISVQRQAVEISPDGHPDKPIWLNNLGNSLQTRFNYTVELDDIESAISAYRRAVKLTPEGHTDRPARFSSLGSSLHTRFERVGEREDIDGAIAAHQIAIETLPDGDSRKPVCLTNLGNAFLRRFEYFTRKLDDARGSVMAHIRAVVATAAGHPDLPSRLGNVGVSLRALFEQFGQMVNLESAIRVHHIAIELTPDDHPYKPVCLGHLGVTLTSRFERTGELSDIKDAISAHRRSIDMTPDGHPSKSMCFSNLGRSLRKRFERNRTADDFNAATKSFMLALAQPNGHPSVRLGCAKSLISMLSAHPELSSVESLLSAHARIFDILPEIIWLGHNIPRRYLESSHVGELVNAAVSSAIRAGRPLQAIEWLEEGRSLIWSQILSLRSPLDELKKHHPSLAEGLYSIQKQLQYSGFAVESNASDSDAIDNVPGVIANPADAHRRLVIEYGRTLTKVRSCVGFEDFLRPKTSTATLASRDHARPPVIFINVNYSRCDALVLLSTGDVSTVPLPELSLDRAAKLRALWVKRVVDSRMRREPRAVVSSGAPNSFVYISRLLGYMWRWIVHPILQALNLTDISPVGRLPHITWCPTGPITQLPLHAAGIYSEEGGPRAYDLVISSYTPSLSALQRCIDGLLKHSPPPNALIVTQPTAQGHSPLPGTVEEGLHLRDILASSHIPATLLNSEHGSVSSVRAIFDQHSWIHLACHGVQYETDATRSAFMLYDGPLSLSSLMSMAVDQAELAFLSACQTAMGDAKNPEESVHLAAGMLAVGFKGVIATMWSIGDTDAPVVVEAYYKELLRVRKAGELGEGETGAAYALHEAVKYLREKVGEENFDRWVPFVHYGV